MSLHIYPKQSRIPLLVHGSIISSLVVHGPGYPSRAYIRDHLEPTSGTISSQHLGPSRANIWDHLEPTSGTISSQHLGSSRANIWDHLEPTSGIISSQHLGPSSHLGGVGTWDITMSYPQTELLAKQLRFEGSWVCFYSWRLNTLCSDWSTFSYYMSVQSWSSQWWDLSIESCNLVSHLAVLVQAGLAVIGPRTLLWLVQRLCSDWSKDFALIGPRPMGQGLCSDLSKDWTRSPCVLGHLSSRH